MKRSGKSTNVIALAAFVLISIILLTLLLQSDPSPQERDLSVQLSVANQAGRTSIPPALRDRYRAMLPQDLSPETKQAYLEELTRRREEYMAAYYNRARDNEPELAEFERRRPPRPEPPKKPQMPKENPRQRALEEKQKELSDGLIHIELTIPYASTFEAVQRDGTPLRTDRGRSFYCSNIQEKYTLIETMPEPDFFFIGTAKGGSTSFSKYLPAHPLVDEVRGKEPNFFTYPWPRERSKQAYQHLYVNLNHAARAPNAHIAGDYSTDNMVHPLTARRILTYYGGDAKLIVFLRNPIDRAYSHYVMQVRGGHEKYLTFEEVAQLQINEYPYIREAYTKCFNEQSCQVEHCWPTIELSYHDDERTKYVMEDEWEMMRYAFLGYIMRSVYDDQIERYLAIFPRKQIMIMTSEYFYANTVEAMTRITSFLDLPYFDWSKAEILHESWGGGPSNHHEAHDYPPLAESTRQKLREFFEPYNQRLYSIIGEDFGWQ